MTAEFKAIMDRVYAVGVEATFVKLERLVERLHTENAALRSLIQQCADDLAGCGEITAETWRRVQKSAGEG